MNEERMDVVLEEAWEDEGQNYGAPGKAEGFVGERTSTEMNEASPLGGDERYGGCEDDEGEVGADITEQAQGEIPNAEDSAAPGTMPPLNGAPGKADGFVGERRRAEMSEFSPLGGNEGYKGRVDAEPGKEHPLLTRAREKARAQEMERFLTAYPEVKAGDIPREVWQQVAAGVPLVSAYAMHENQQLKMQLAAERQDRLNRQRTPGALGSHSGGELDELDRMWNEDD